MRRLRYAVTDYWAHVVVAGLSLVLLLGGLLLVSASRLPVRVVVGPRVVSTSVNAPFSSPALSAVAAVVAAGASAPGVQAQPWPGADRSTVALDPLVQYCASGGLGSLGPVVARSELVTLSMGTDVGTTATSGTNVATVIAAQAVGAGLGPRAFAAHESLVRNCTLAHSLGVASGGFTTAPILAVRLTTTGANALIEQDSAFSGDSG